MRRRQQIKFDLGNSPVISDFSLAILAECGQSAAMARAWRIEYEGALYHVRSRGNERCRIVVDDKYQHLFLDTVGEMSQRFELV